MKINGYLLVCLLTCTFVITGCGISREPVPSAEKTAVSSALPEEKPQQDKLKKRVASMSLEEKIGQMFFARCNHETAIEDLENYAFGGYILFGADTEQETAESLKEKIETYQQASEIPLLIGVDEEGGTVSRIGRYPQYRSVPFLSPQELYARGGFEMIRKDTEEKCSLLKELGFNVNLAPVCDVPDTPQDFMYPRAFGTDPAQTAEYVRAVVDTMRQEKIGSVLKHFPGYGNNADTHTGTAVDNRPYERFETVDFVPFRAGIEAGAGAVLVSHNVMACVDEEYPASLSPAVHEILREQLGFDGVVMTDDLIMDGVNAYAGDSAAAVLAIRAGNDMLISSDYVTDFAEVALAVVKGEISEERIDESVSRILQWKENLGLLE